MRSNFPHIPVGAVVRAQYGDQIFTVVGKTRHPYSLVVRHEPSGTTHHMLIAEMFVPSSDLVGA